MSTKKQMSVGHRAVIKGVFGIEPDEFVTDEFDKLVEDWARRVGHGYIDGARLRYDSVNDKWVVVQDGGPADGYVNNQIFVPEGPVDGVDIIGGMSKDKNVIIEDDNETEYSCDCDNPRCNLPNGIFCSNPMTK